MQVFSCQPSFSRKILPFGGIPLLALGLVALAPPESCRVLAQNAPVDKVPVAANYGRVPLSFEGNLGQTDPQVLFTSRGAGYTLFLTNSEAVLSLEPKKTDASQASRKGKLPIDDQSETESIRMQLLRPSKKIAISGQDQLLGTANYFIGSDRSKWRSNVPTYRKVQYKSVYNGIDLLYYGNQRQLEYDFIVAPHADPGQI